MSNKSISESLVKNHRTAKPQWRRFIFWYALFIVLFGAGFGLQYASGSRPDSVAGILWLLSPPLFALVFVNTVRKMEEWERAVVLRLGRFHRVRGPGLFLKIPLVDRIAETVDLRIRVSDFTAETTLSKDSVTVTVDALCFWLVWDAEKAVCEVQDYEAAVILSAKTALRSAISQHDLSIFLEQNGVIEDVIQKTVDRKTNEWGVTVQHIEITDIQIPENLQESLSRTAQAEREKKGRILLAEAEIDIARRLAEAAALYPADGIALRLKQLSILNEGFRAGNSMTLVPDSIAGDLNGTDVFGLQALGELRKGEKA